jgi:membrane protein YdbS with pleckstrin-like domain
MAMFNLSISLPEGIPLYFLFFVHHIIHQNHSVAQVATSVIDTTPAHIVSRHGAPLWILLDAVCIIYIIIYNNIYIIVIIIKHQHSKWKINEDHYHSLSKTRT